jgi:15,16-dihydrobiliverdin:ferredoxin oxidoreductase
MGQTLKLHFNDILLETLKQHFKLKQEELPEDFAYKATETGGSLIEQKSSLYSFEKVEQVKVGAFNAEGAVYVRNCSIWPAENYDFPILMYDSAEVKRWLFMLLDLHPLQRDEPYRTCYVEPLAELKKRYKDIPLIGGARQEPRDWTKPFSSGYALYARCPKEYEDRIEQGLKDYLNFYIERIKEATPVEDATRRAQALKVTQEFKDVYAENDPGGGAYETFFGKEWTERFLRDFLFV